jgi:hypothetical protein
MVFIRMRDAADHIVLKAGVSLFVEMGETGLATPNSEGEMSHGRS